MSCVRKSLHVFGLMLICMLFLGNTTALADKIPWPTDVTNTYKGGFSLYAGHNGMDINAKSGSVLYAPFDGTAVFRQRYRSIGDKNVLVSYGNYVEITSRDGKYKIDICHMSAFEDVDFVAKNLMNAVDYWPNHDSTISVASWKNTDHDDVCGRNDDIHEGDILGYSGGTGRSTGPHLHVTLHVNGSLVDPYSYFDSTISARDHARRVTIQGADKTIYVGDVDGFAATSTRDGETIYWESSDPSIVEVDSNGAYKGVAVGTAVISAYLKDDDGNKIAGSVDSHTITVEKRVTTSKKNTTIKLSKKKATLYEGKTLLLKATVNNKVGKITWSSSKRSVAIVSSKGLVKAKKAGTTIITAKCNGKKATCKITVNDYKSIYRKALEKKTFSYKEGKTRGTITAEYFLVFNIDQKGVPELIVCPYQFPNGHSGYIYTIKDGKLKYCGTYSHKGYQSFMYVKKYKSVYYSWWTNGIGGAGAQLLKLNSSGKLKPYKFFYECQENMYSSKRLYYSGKSSIKNSVLVSKKKYAKLTKKYLGKVKAYKYVKNTEDERKKALK